MKKLIILFVCIISACSSKWGYKNGKLMENGWVDTYTLRVKRSSCKNGKSLSEKQLLSHVHLDADYGFLLQMDILLRKRYKNPHSSYSFEYDIRKGKLKYLAKKSIKSSVVLLKSASKHGCVTVIKQYNCKEIHGFIYKSTKNDKNIILSAKEKRKLKKKQKMKFINKWKYKKRKNGTYGFIDRNRFRIFVLYELKQLGRGKERDARLLQLSFFAIKKIHGVFKAYLNCYSDMIGASNKCLGIHKQHKIKKEIKQGNFVSYNCNRSSGCKAVYEFRYEKLRDLIFDRQ